jgi:hypothetical protein
MGLIIAFFVVCGIGIGSSYLIGPDNPLEEEMEEFAENILAVEIHMPDGSIEHGWLDLSPNTPEKPRAYMKND